MRPVKGSHGTTKTLARMSIKDCVHYSQPTVGKRQDIGGRRQLFQDWRNVQRINFCTAFIVLLSIYVQIPKGIKLSRTLNLCNFSIDSLFWFRSSEHPVASLKELFVINGLFDKRLLQVSSNKAQDITGMLLAGMQLWQSKTSWMWKGLWIFF